MGFTLQQAGLATDAELAAIRDAVNAPAFGPITTTDAGLLAMESGGNLANILAQAQSGIAPYAPAMRTLSFYNVGYSTGTLIELGLNSRIWAVSLSASLYTTSAYAGGAGFFASIGVSGGVQGLDDTLALIQFFLNAPSLQHQSDIFLPFPGLYVEASGTIPAGIGYSINADAAIADTGVRAAGVVFYTQP